MPLAVGDASGHVTTFCWRQYEGLETRASELLVALVFHIVLTPKSCDEEHSMHLSPLLTRRRDPANGVVLRRR